MSEQMEKLAISGRLKRCEIGNFTVIAEANSDSAPVGYIADSLTAIDLVRAYNHHEALLAACKLALDDAGELNGVTRRGRIREAIANAEGK